MLYKDVSSLIWPFICSQVTHILDFFFNREPTSVDQEINMFVQPQIVGMDKGLISINFI